MAYLLKWISLLFINKGMDDYCYLSSVSISDRVQEVTHECQYRQNY